MDSSPDLNNNMALPLEPASAKRRAVVVLERTSKNSLLDGGDFNGMNNGHTMRGEALLERSRDLSLLKKGVIGTSFPSKRKRSVHRQAKPFWQTVISSLTKNLLLLAALLYVGQVIWKWTSGVNYPLSDLDFGSRISEVESSLKKTATMLQVQLDVVDKKIGNEIGIATNKLTKQIEEKGKQFEKDVSKLQAITDDLGSSFSQLKSAGLLTKEEFDKFSNELSSRNSYDAYKGVDLDRIMALAKEVVEKEIEKHAADGIGRVDYALASGGARVVKHSEPYVLGKSSSWLGVAKVKNNVHSSARKMLEPSFGEPGQCFPLQGDNGFVELRLRTLIIPDAITLEHVSKSVAYDRSSAPKDCRVYGWLDEPEHEPTNPSEKMTVLTEFSYDLDKSNVQTFPIPTTNARVINAVRLDFVSNHGSPALTCIYRFRVHGIEPSSPLTVANQP